MYRLAPVAAGAATIWALCILPVAAESPPPRWNGPFGGQFHASFTVASDYAQSGISNTQNKPAFQMGIDWHSPYLLENGPPRRLPAIEPIRPIRLPR